jgi:hypothetical protein
MKKIIIASTCLLWANLAISQDPTVQDLKNVTEKEIVKDPNDTIPKIWKIGGQFGLTVNQGSLSNWSAGGDKFSFSLNASANLYAFYKKDRHSWDNSLDLAYGTVQTTSLGKRKASDRIEFTSKYGYALRKKVNLAGLFNFRSQFANGYAYNKDVNGADSSSLTSKPFAPIYMLLSLGLDYRPNDDFSLFVSPVTARWVIASDKLIGPLYGIEPGKTVKNEFGAFLSATYNKKFGKNLQFKTKLDLFSNYLENPQNIDIFWTNVLSASITKYITFNLNVDMIYDDDTKNIDPTKGPAPQWLQLMGIGFAYRFAAK